MYSIQVLIQFNFEAELSRSEKVVIYIYI